GRDYEMESVLPEVSLSQHRDQDPRNGRAAFRVFASTNVKCACRPETILSKPLFQGQVSGSPRMNCSPQRCASSSVICTGGRFAKYAEGEWSAPPISRSSASLQQRIASITRPAELGESSPEGVRSSSMGMSRKT